MLWLVTLVQILLAPLTALRFAIRFLNPKLHQEFVPEAWTPIIGWHWWRRMVRAFGTSGEPNAAHLPDESKTFPNALHIIFIGPTLGEYRVMAALAEELLRENPNLQITYCLRDRRSVTEIKRQNLNVTYRPVDFLPITTRWVKHLRPDALVFIEGMRFPILAWTAHLAGAKNILVNGRATRREKLHHRLRAPYFRWLFRPFDLLLFQEENHLENAKPWLSPNTQALAVGNLKLALPPPTVPPEILESLTAWLGQGPFLAAGSTADTEEEFLVLDAFFAVRQIEPCRLLLAPRLPGRADECAALIQSRGLSISRRTSPTANADVFLLDTLGELNAAYHLCRVAYVGNFFRGKGHNVLEPVAAGIPVAYGPNPGEFGDLRTLCEAYGVGTPVSSAEELAACWTKTLSMPAPKEQTKALLQGRSAPLHQTAAQIRELLK